MKNIIWIAVLAGAALAVLNWWGKRNEIKVTDKPVTDTLSQEVKDKLTECGKLPGPQQAACMGFKPMVSVQPPRNGVNLSVV